MFESQSMARGSAMVDGWVGWALVEFQGFQVFGFDLAGSNEACSTENHCGCGPQVRVPVKAVNCANGY